MKYKNRTLIKTSILFLFLFIGLILTGCKTKQEIKTINGVEVVCYNIHTTDQDNYLNNNYDSITSYAKGSKEESRPLSISLNIKNKKNNDIYTVIISENEDYSNPVLNIETTEKDLEIYNLKIKTIYYWKATNNKNSETVNGNPFYIDEECIRNIYVDGVTNVRDIGGWTTSDGKTVKQGLIYRSAKFNNDESTELVITSDGINTMVNDLKIKTELDLRTVDDNENGGITTSPLGESVEYISFPMVSNGNIMLLNKKKLASLFSILADESKYPLVFHCSIGTDRTGFVAFMMNALLGVSEEDLYKDYLFSNFGNIGSPRTTNTMTKNYIEYLEPYEGSNLKEKLITFLVKEGVSQSDIDSFISIMKEE